MATVDYIHHLAFPKLRDAEAKHLAGMATICDFKDGELVFQVGRRGLPLYVVESGAVAAGDVRSDTTKRVAFAVGDGALAVTCAHHVLGEL
jgi:hypothetical protein